MPHLFDPIAFRSLVLANRIVVSPMCEYSSSDGYSNDWHLVHLGSRAVGGAALVMTEATAVTATGRISPQDLGIYDDGHVDGLARIVRFVHDQKTLAGIQLAHAGRKGSTARPWDGGGRLGPEAGGWQPVGPTAAPFAESYPVPCPLATVEIAQIVAAFRLGAQRALAAGFDVIEIHAAHGYLIHEFLSPDPFRTACASVSRSSTPFALSGPIACRCSSGSRRPTGSRAGGISIRRFGWRGC
jgi:2,4-dienoyl-CoA reductase-like NADH-dependent reductase (Old Yellow Enzyme family)